MANSTKPKAPLLVVLSYLAFLTVGLYTGLMGVAWPSMRDSFGLVALASIGPVIVVLLLGVMIGGLR